MNRLAEMTASRQLIKKQKNLDFSGGTFSPDLMAQIIVQGYREKKENKIEYPPTSKKKIQKLLNVSNFVKRAFYRNCYKSR